MADRTIPHEAIAGMVRAVDPDARVVDAALADSGYLSVYRTTVETGEGTGEWVLKAPPDGGDHGIGLEARLLALLGERTSIPVPGVVGAVDDHAEFPAPFVVMEAVDGRTVPRTELEDLSTGTLAGIARGLGEHLAALHALDAVEAFGYLEPAGPALRGEQPPADPATVRVADPGPSWPVRLREWADAELEAQADTRFGDLTPRLRPVLLEAVESISGTFRPALAHVDGSIENLLLDDAGGVRAVLDWAFTVAAPPAYDLVCVEHSLAGGHWAFVPDVPDVRPAVREGLLEGYRPGPAGVLDRLERHREAYDLLWLVRATTLFDGWFDLKGVDPARTEAAANEARAALEAWL